ncbi:MAG: AsmA family protein [Rhodobacteraceae bacterium]|nr:AsmA family protein [Paracoccaceae bacterium]
MRWIVRIIIAVVALVVVAVGLVFLLPAEKIGQIASDQLERTTGRKLTLSGEFRPTIYPTLGVKTGPITISNADWSEDPVMIEASGAAVGVGLAALFGGELDVRKLRLIDPVIRLERARDGRVNWDLAGTDGSDSNAGSGATAGPPTDFSLALGEVVNGHLIFKDAQNGQTVEVSEINAALSVPKNASSATLKGGAVWQGKAATVDAEIADWKALMGGGVSAVDTKFAASGLSGELAGIFGIGGSDMPTVDGTATVTVADMQDVRKLMGLKTLPGPIAGVKNAKATGQLQLSAAGLFFDGDTALELNGLPLAAKLVLTGAERWQDTLAFEVLADVAADKALKMNFDGVVAGSNGTARGKLKAESGNPRKLLSAFGIAADMPKGTFNSLSAAGDLRVEENGTIALQKSRLSMDQNVVNGLVSIATGGTPFVTANLQSKALDLSAYTSDGEAGGGGGGSGATGWSKEPIGLSGLDVVDADVKLKADSVNLGVSQLGFTSIRALLKDGLLTLRLSDVRAYRGAMAGKVSVRGGKALSFDSDVVAKDMQLEPLLGQLLGIDRLIGTGTTKLKLAGTGSSIHQVMNSLSGTGEIEFADGAFKGIDLAAMMRNLKSAFGGFEGATEFTSMTGTFSMTKGVLDNVDLSLVSPLFKAGGKGQVNVGGQAMNYVVTPSTLSGGAEYSVPVIITGPWHDLKFRPDLEKLINLLLDTKLKDNEAVQKAKEKLDKAKEKLKDPEATIKKKAKKKLAEKLGVTDGTAEDEATENVEDKVEEKVEDAVKDALKKLFD